MPHRSFVLPTLTLAVVLFGPTRATAHDLRAEVKVTADAVRVVASYEGEDPADGATATLTSAAGEVVATGKTDDKGVWTCPRPAPGTYTLVVEQAGHRRKEIVEVPGDGKETAVTPNRLDKGTALAIGLGVIVLAGLLFKFTRRKPASEGSP